MNYEYAAFRGLDLFEEGANMADLERKASYLSEDLLGIFGEKPAENEDLAVRMYRFDGRVRLRIEGVS